MRLATITPTFFSAEEIQARVRELGPWFHNMNLGGVMTAPDHFLGNYPTVKWERFKNAIPADLTGKTVLDIGCNAGFYSIEMKRRGAARVVAIDSDPSYLAQARFAAEVRQVDIEFRELDVYNIAKLGEKFDLVLFLGVFYHLRHPLLALDLLHEHVAKDILVFQSLLRGNPALEPVREDYDFWDTDIFDRPSFPRVYFIENQYAHDPTNWWFANRAGAEAMLRSAGFEIADHPEEEVFICRRVELQDGPHVVYPAQGEPAMIEAVMLWNEPNNLSHWDFEIDPEWKLYGQMVKDAAKAIETENPKLVRVLGGISPIDPKFIGNMRDQGVLDTLNVVAVHGFPLDWNHWTIHEWPDKLKEIQAVTDLPIWVSEVGVSSFGAEEVQAFGLRRTAELLIGKSERIHWYSLFDLPRTWPATTRHREAEGSSYYRHFYMGLVREDGMPKLALEHFHTYAPELGIAQWFHFNDPRLEDGVKWLRKLGVRYLRTGLSWADHCRPNALEWFDRQMKALEEFQVTLTFCFTPESEGVRPHHTSPPKDAGKFAEFCAEMTRRYA